MLVILEKLYYRSLSRLDYRPRRLSRQRQALLEELAPKKIANFIS